MTEKTKLKTSRKAETREKVARKRGWVPPSNLEAPDPPEGYQIDKTYRQSQMANIKV